MKSKNAGTINQINWKNAELQVLNRKNPPACCLLMISPLFSPIRHYFVSSPYLASNPGEQFYMFTIIAAWLINVAGRPFTEPQEYDEPNATVSNILAELRAFVSDAQSTNSL